MNLRIRGEAVLLDGGKPVATSRNAEETRFPLWACHSITEIVLPANRINEEKVEMIKFRPKKPKHSLKKTKK
jgi:hypothetical protein